MTTKEKAALVTLQKMMKRVFEGEERGELAALEITPEGFGLFDGDGNVHCDSASSLEEVASAIEIIGA